MSKYALQIRTIEEKILVLRGHKVMLDYDLAHLYGLCGESSRPVSIPSTKLQRQYSFPLNTPHNITFLHIRRPSLSELLFQPISYFSVYRLSSQSNILPGDSPFFGSRELTT